ncbi:DUF4258 domain-containing protein [Mariniflexile ostreae]|uniref:DUF4258 domain-containing protein n=1 Tax=Mariniflexile ostreae TaxID=1520892 RepID=A0ABV5FDY6_9FLAO
MKLIQRIGYYLVGFSLGLVVLAFFFNGKKTSCSYGPEARVLKNINLKTLAYSTTALRTMEQEHIDTVTVKEILLKGDINFNNDKSDSRKKPCGTYYIEEDFKDKTIALLVENCDSTATLLDLYIE